MRVDDAQTLEDYLKRFDVTVSVMQSEEALERIAYELAEDAAEDGVRYIEVRNAPILNVVQGLTLVQAIEAPLRGGSACPCSRGSAPGSSAVLWHQAAAAERWSS